MLCRRLERAGIPDSYETLRRELAGWMRVATSLRAADGSWIECRQDVRPGPEAAELARAMGVVPGVGAQANEAGGGPVVAPLRERIVRLRTKPVVPQGPEYIHKSFSCKHLYCPISRMAKAGQLFPFAGQARNMHR